MLRTQFGKNIYFPRNVSIQLPIRTFTWLSLIPISFNIHSCCSLLWVFNSPIHQFNCVSDSLSSLRSFYRLKQKTSSFSFGRHAMLSLALATVLPATRQAKNWQVTLEFLELRRWAQHEEDVWMGAESRNCAALCLLLPALLLIEPPRKFIHKKKKRKSIALIRRTHLWFTHMCVYQSGRIKSMKLITLSCCLLLFRKQS